MGSTRRKGLAWAEVWIVDQDGSQESTGGRVASHALQHSARTRRLLPLFPELCSRNIAGKRHEGRMCVAMAAEPRSIGQPWSGAVVH
eukprot:scaffold33650_cov19-Prasinocladus_malaysianus.AAC.1